MDHCTCRGRNPTVARNRPVCKRRAQRRFDQPLVRISLSSSSPTTSPPAALCIQQIPFFSIAKSPGFKCGDRQCIWSDMVGTLYRLEVYHASSATSLYDVLAAALFQSIQSKEPGPDDEDEIGRLRPNRNHQGNQIFLTRRGAVMCLW